MVQGPVVNDVDQEHMQHEGKQHANRQSSTAMYIHRHIHDMDVVKPLKTEQ